MSNTSKKAETPKKKEEVGPNAFFVQAQAGQKKAAKEAMQNAAYDRNMKSSNAMLLHLGLIALGTVLLGSLGYALAFGSNGVIGFALVGAILGKLVYNRIKLIIGQDFLNKEAEEAAQRKAKEEEEKKKANEGK